MMVSTDVETRATEPDMGRFVELYGDTMLRLCFLYLKDIQLAEDAVQDTFVRVYKNYKNFDGDCHEKTWLTRIAINVCKNYLRSSWRWAWWERFDEAAILDKIPIHGSDDLIYDDTLVLEIMKLPPKYKEVILLFYYQELKIREISDALQIPESTASIRLKRAREKLKLKLKGWYYDE